MQNCDEKYYFYLAAVVGGIFGSIIATAILTLI